MNPWGPLAATLAYNYLRHRRHKPTLCSTARRFVPAAGMAIGWGVLTGWLVDHYYDGFKVTIDRLTD